MRHKSSDKMWVASGWIRSRLDVGVWKFSTSSTSFFKFPFNIQLATISLLYLAMSHYQSIILFSVMPKPSISHWMATRSGNSNAHPGAVNIRVKEEMVDHPPNTPSPRKKRARSKKKSQPKRSKLVYSMLQLMRGSPSMMNS